MTRKELYEIKIVKEQGKTCNYYKVYIQGGTKIGEKVYHYLYDDALHFLERKKKRFILTTTPR